MGALTAIVGAPGRDPVLDAIAATITGPAVRFEGVLGLLDAVRAHCVRTGPIPALDVVGHASAGALALSTSDPEELLGVCHRSFGFLIQLRGDHALVDGAPITFVGCELAGRSRHDRTQDGPLVLLAVSRYLGCPVAGTTRSIAVEDFGPDGLRDDVRGAHTLVVEPGSALPVGGWLEEQPVLPGAPLSGMTLGGVAPALLAPDLESCLEDEAVWDGAGLLDRPGPRLQAGKNLQCAWRVSVTLNGRAVVIEDERRRLIVRKRLDSPPIAWDQALR